MNDRIPYAQAAGLPNSLCLIRVPRVELSVFAPGAAFGNPKKRVQARFKYFEIGYWLWVTDPLERAYIARGDGIYQLDETYLTVSIGEQADDGYCYKLVAAVISK